MPRSRRDACVLVALALIGAAVLSGCAGGEAPGAQAESHAGILGGVIAQLKREDDESELAELAEQGPVTKQEREELHESEEQRELEEEQAGEEEEHPGEAQPTSEAEERSSPPEARES